MAYVKQSWENYPATTTPVTAARLSHIEDGIEAADVLASAASASVLLKAPINNPALTGVPTAPTASLGTDTTQIATTAFVRAETAALVDAAPVTLDTLTELAAALGDDPSFATTVATSLGLKAPIASPTFTGVPAAPTAAANTNTTQLATTAYVDTADSVITALKFDISPTQNVQTGDYTIALADATSGKVVLANKATAIAFTIPPQASVTWTSNNIIRWANKNDGVLTITPGAGVTFIGSVLTFNKGQGGSAIRTASNEWVIVPFSSGSDAVARGTLSGTTGSPATSANGGATAYKWTADGTFTVATAGLFSARVVGGGGGGGAGAGSYGAGGGGGAGGVADLTDIYLAAGTYTVKIGAGGVGGNSGQVTGLNGVSSALGPFVAAGGGGGAAGTPLTADADKNGSAGGSGGGGCGGYSNTTGGAATFGQGNVGGNSTVGSGGAPGGGGAGAAGTNSVGVAGGAGGAGVASSITGSSVTVGGGGGGGDYTSGGGGAGGSGGGGAGGSGGAGTAGTANTGGGGGGGSVLSGGVTAAAGAAGGSGVVILLVGTV